MTHFFVEPFFSWVIIFSPFKDISFAYSLSEYSVLHPSVGRHDIVMTVNNDKKLWNSAAVLLELLLTMFLFVLFSESPQKVQLHITSVLLISIT